MLKAKIEIFLIIRRFGTAGFERILSSVQCARNETDSKDFESHPEKLPQGLVEDYQTVFGYIVVRNSV